MVLQIINDFFSQVTTISPDGLLLVIGQPFSNNMIALELISGFPVVTWNVGTEAGQIMVNNSRIDNGLPVVLKLDITDDHVYLASG